MCIEDCVSAQTKAGKLQTTDAIKHESVNSLGVSPVAITGAAGLCTGSEFIATMAHYS